MKMTRYQILYHCSISVLSKIVSSFLKGVNHTIVENKTVSCGKIRYSKYFLLEARLTAERKVIP